MYLIFTVHVLKLYNLMTILSAVSIFGDLSRDWDDLATLINHISLTHLVSIQVQDSAEARGVINLTISFALLERMSTVFDILLHIVYRFHVFQIKSICSGVSKERLGQHLVFSHNVEGFTEFHHLSLSTGFCWSCKVPHKYIKELHMIQDVKLWSTAKCSEGPKDELNDSSSFLMKDITLQV